MALDRLRPTAAAEQLQTRMTIVNRLLGDLERRGYLTLEPDLTDGRARIVRLTRKGRRLGPTARLLGGAAPLDHQDPPDADN